MKKFFLTFLTLAVVFVSCDKDNVRTADQIKEKEVEQHMLRFGEETVLGKKLDDPYALANMQAVSPVPLSANFLYVRFLPKSDRDIFLLQMKGLQLFEYPLDYEIVVTGKTYHDPSLPEDAVTWQYTVVPVDFEFPDIRYEILEQCYIPEDDFELVAASYRNLGYERENFTKSTAAGQSADDDLCMASLTVWPDDLGLLSSGGNYPEGLKGVTVCWRDFVFGVYAKTDVTGYAQARRKFYRTPTFSVIFNNEKGFSLWKDISCVSAVSYNLCKGTVVNIELGPETEGDTDGSYVSECWDLGIINNAAYDYYEFCNAKGIELPPSNLKIWDWTFLKSSSATMIRRVNGYKDGKVTKAAALLIGTLSHMVRLPLAPVLPDLTIGTAYCRDYDYVGNCYRIIYKATWHELTHASHFSQAGKDVWAKFIDYIAGYGAYGTGEVRKDEDLQGMNICGLGESWAYANDRYRQKELFGRNYNSVSYLEWFYDYYISIFNVLDQGVLTREQMFECLLPDVRSYNDFYEALILKYPDVGNKLEELMMPE